MSEGLIAAVDALEAVICERYNVRSLSGVGPFAEAIAQARVGNLELIDKAMAGREMYRWRETADAALAAIRAAADPNDDEANEEPEASDDSADDDEANEDAPKRRARK